VSVVIVIPARYQSSRFPGKPLAPLKGASGVSKSLIRRAWDAANEVSGVSRIVVATDDDRIADAARAFDAEVVMTSSECENGTARCYDALSQLGNPEIIVNLQGDAPLTPPWFVEALIDAMKNGAEVATPVLRCDAETYQNFVEDRKAGRVGGTTAVFWKPGPLESLEGLEQLRFLENGVPIQCVEVEAPGRVFWELNNPVDTPRVEAALKKLGVE